MCYTNCIILWGEKMDKINRVKELVEYLNICCDEYYNQNNPSLSDAQYDALFDELTALENETGLILANSPTQRPGYEVLSSLKKVEHDIPLLSLAKTKLVSDVYDMAQTADGYLGLKMDGLTVKITYQNGEIVSASTRGDGQVGEDITHNARVFSNVPRKIPYTEKLVISGEAFITVGDFEKINDAIELDEEKYSTPRNLAAGSVRQLDSAVCAARHVSFMPFNVLEGFDDLPRKLDKLKRLESFGFALIPHFTLTANDTEATAKDKIFSLKDTANKLGYPIDGVVFTYDDIEFGATLGRTSHHFKDGIAFKFGDPHFETTLRKIVWNISRTGQLTPIAEFDTVEIDNTNVERASLHNITFIENLKLEIGDTILVSKRNMIIPHVESNITGENENRDSYQAKAPDFCPVCHSDTAIKTTLNSGSEVKVLYCGNDNCPGRQIKKFTHFVSKPALNIEGLSEATLIKFMELGWIKTLSDIFRLPEHRSDIISMDGFGEKSYNNLCESLENAKNTSLSALLVAMNISLLGKSAAKEIEDLFAGDVNEFLNKIDEGFCFTVIDGFGDTINDAIHSWFKNTENRKEFEELLGIITVQKWEKKEIDTDNMFFGKTVVITGKFSTLNRDGLTEKMQDLGAKVAGSVSKKTDFLLMGEDAGSKKAKAESLGVRIIPEEELATLIEL